MELARWQNAYDISHDKSTKKIHKLNCNSFLDSENLPGVSCDLGGFFLIRSLIFLMTTWTLIF